MALASSPSTGSTLSVAGAGVLLAATDCASDTTSTFRLLVGSTSAFSGLTFAREASLTLKSSLADVHADDTETMYSRFDKYGDEAPRWLFDIYGNDAGYLYPEYVEKWSADIHGSDHNNEHEQIRIADVIKVIQKQVKDEESEISFNE